jgi:hypothetical protein
MKKSKFISSVLFVFILMTSCQKNELSKKKELSDTNSLQSDLSQKKGGIRNDGERNDIKVGSYYGGGIVFYIDETGRHGLIAATEDAGIAEWGCMGTLTAETSLHIGTGQQNTLAMLDACEETGTAAQLCDSWIFPKKGGKVKQHNNDFAFNEGGGRKKEKSDDHKGKKYDDWFLPSFFEASRLFETLELLKNTDPGLVQLFPNGPYWSSTQGDNRFMGQASDGATTAFLLHVNTVGEPIYATFQVNVEIAPKNFKAKVRPIRAF